MKNTNKKIVICFSLMIVLIAFGMTGCKTNEPLTYPEYDVVDNTELGCIELHNDGIVYRPYGIFNTRDFRGRQIGIREDDPEAKICEVKGYEPGEWIIDYLDVFMGGGDMLFKAVDVVDIPSELEQYKEYDY